MARRGLALILLFAFALAQAPAVPAAASCTTMPKACCQCKPVMFGACCCRSHDVPPDPAPPVPASAHQDLLGGALLPQVVGVVAPPLNPAAFLATAPLASPAATVVPLYILHASFLS